MEIGEIGRVAEFFLRDGLEARKERLAFLMAGGMPGYRPATFKTMAERLENAE